ncbi:putative HTH-type transcriptional regulator [Halioglobus japonicus]|nr:putative HTH-type transcriptional regulator [Halioglobus japonicus]
MPNTTTPAQYILILIDMIEQRGCDLDKLLAGTSLANTGISTIGARIPDEDFNQLVNNALELTGDKTLGLKLGFRLNLSAHAVLGQAFMTCTDLAQAIELFLKYNHLLASDLHFEFETIDEQCILTIVNTPPGNVFTEFGYELFYGALINTLRGLLNAPDLSLCMEFPYPRPEHHAMYYEMFGDDVHFDSPQGRILFRQELLDTPLPSSNPVLRNLYEAECARLLADLEEDNSVTKRTLRLLRKLEGQYPQMPQIAAMLNLSPRTYRRRLDDEQQSFQQLLDQVRAEHATRHLQNKRLPLSSIAYMVGFSDTSNFRRAYIKWTGKSPGEVRRG